jgi:hypothetical protein
VKPGELCHLRLPSHRILVLPSLTGGVDGIEPLPGCPSLMADNDVLLAALLVFACCNRSPAEHRSQLNNASNAGHELFCSTAKIHCIFCHRPPAL